MQCKLLVGMLIVTWSSSHDTCHILLYSFRHIFMTVSWRMLPEECYLKWWRRSSNVQISYLLISPGWRNFKTTGQSKLIILANATKYLPVVPSRVLVLLVQLYCGGPFGTSGITWPVFIQLVMWLTYFVCLSSYISNHRTTYIEQQESLLQEYNGTPREHTRGRA